jgi:hypothetical protein
MSLKERINLVKQQFGISEADTLNIEKALGKKLVDYESIEALVAALMGYYNGELKKKAASSHTHDDRYFTESEINEKFKNFCPYQIGDIYLTTNSTNPSSVFLGTTWQKIEGRFLLGTSGSGTSKTTGGSNSRTIVQANLPNIKLAVDSFSLSRGTQNITGSADTWTYQSETISSGALYFSGTGKRNYNVNGGWSGTSLKLDASKTWTGSTNSVSPQTSALGSGRALDITPSYYTCHMWLRLT